MVCSNIKSSTIAFSLHKYFISIDNLHCCNDIAITSSCQTLV
jgi:hypothetical protein